MVNTLVTCHFHYYWLDPTLFWWNFFIETRNIFCCCSNQKYYLRTTATTTVATRNSESSITGCNNAISRKYRPCDMGNCTCGKCRIFSSILRPIKRQRMGEDCCSNIDYYSNSNPTISVMATSMFSASLHFVNLFAKTYMEKRR